MRILKVFLLFILVGLLAYPADAQLSRKKIKRNNKAMSKFRGRKNTFSKQQQYSYLGFSLNAMTYLGDIAPKATWGSTKLGFTRPGFSATYGYRFGPRYSAQASFSYGRLQSDDFEVADPGNEESRYRYVRNSHFRNDIFEFSAVAIIDLYKNSRTYLNRVEFTPYAFLGGAVYHHNPMAQVPEQYILPADPASHYAFDNAGEWVELQPLGTEGQYADLLETDVNFGIKPYKLWQFAIPIGIGVRYRLNDALDVSADISFRILFTDYIDDVSRNYVDLGVLDSDLARAMADRTREPFSANGDPRDITGLDYISVYDVVGRDGNTYTIVRGYGEESATNKRGGANSNDMYYVTSVRIAYIIGGRFKRAKFR